MVGVFVGVYFLVVVEWVEYVIWFDEYGFDNDGNFFELGCELRNELRVLFGFEWV